MSTPHSVVGARAEADEWGPRLVPLAVGCERLHLSRSTAYRLIEEGRFPVTPIRVGGRWFVRTTELDEVTDPSA